MFRTIFQRRILQWLGPLVTVGIIAFAAAAIMIVGGLSNPKASTPHPQYLAHLIHYTFSRVSTHLSREDPPPADLYDPSRIVIGAGHFVQVFANCHGEPGLGQQPFAMAMTPRPPYLPADIHEIDDRQAFFTVKQGVKYAGMPSWPNEVRDDEIWDMVAFVRQLPHLNYAQYRALAYGTEDQAAGKLPQIPFGTTPAEHPYAMTNSKIPKGVINFYSYPVSGPLHVAEYGNPPANCARRHGADGRGRAEGRILNLSTQNPEYIQRELVHFASGTQKSGIMQTAATQHSMQQMAGVAKYYAALGEAPALFTTSRPVDPALIAVGRGISEGVGVKGSSCNYCRNLKREGAQVFPHLQGQNVRYALNQLRLFRYDGRIGPEVDNPMLKIAKGLSEHDMAAIAAYYAAQPPAANGIQAPG